jgi:NTE family protein
VSEVRTDMDGFSSAEIQVLENHGYALAEAAIRTHAAEFISPDAAPFALPHPAWQDERKVRDALRQSHRRVLRWWFRWWGA